MFLYDFTIVDAPVELVARALAAGGPEILRSAAADAGAATPSAPVVGALRDRAGGWVVPVRWDGSGWPGPFALLYGELEISAMDGGRTHLSVSASLEQPGPRTESRSETQRRRHETERVVRAFVTALGERSLAEGSA